MKKIKRPLKLSLNRETIKIIDTHQLDRVAGGEGPNVVIDSTPAKTCVGG